MEIEKLNSYSQIVYELVKEKYPDWIGLANETDHEKGAFKIIITSPQGTNLEICTCNNEITISFSYYHSHFGGWYGISPEDAFKEVEPFIKDLQSGRIFVASVFEDNKLRYSTTVNASDLEQFKAKFKGTNHEPRIVGWSCTI